MKIRQNHCKKKWLFINNKMKKLLITILIIITTIITVFAQDTLTLKGGVSLIDKVPKQLFDIWIVTAKLEETNSAGKFHENIITLWTFTKENSIIKLTNPLNGISENLNLSEVYENKIKFKKITTKNQKILTDIIDIKLDKNKFTGYNIIEIKEEVKDKKNTYEYGKYKLSGEKYIKEKATEERK